MADDTDEMLVDGCFLTWVQVTEQYVKKGEITEDARDFRKKRETRKD